MQTIRNAIGTGLICLVVFGIIFQKVAPLCILVNFKLNQSEIAANLCQKRFEKGNCCKGKCYLNNQLKENEKKEKSPNTVKDKEEVWILANVNRIQFIPFIRKTTVSSFEEPLISGIVSLLFKPPQ